MKKTSSKILVFIVFVVLVLSILLQGTFFIIQTQFKKSVSEQNRQILQDSFDRLVQSEVQTIVSGVKSMHENGLARNLSEAQIKKRLLNT